MQPLSKIIAETKLSRQVRDILFEDIFGLSREQILTKQNIMVGRIRYLKFKRFEKIILNGYPYQYLINTAFFYKSNFYVNKNVLCPRPETELIVEKALSFIKKHLSHDKEISIIDIGTGSGCIAISLYKELKNHFPSLNTKIFATDISRKAINVARKNAITSRANVKCFVSDLFSNASLPKKFDLIVANLPYLPTSHLKESPDLKNEPTLALDGGEDGLKIIKKFTQILPYRLKHGGQAIIEIHPGQEGEIIDQCSKLSLTSKSAKDLNLRTRFVLINSI